MHADSLDEKKAQAVVEEIKAAGGDAIAIGGDVGADDFPTKIIDATIQCVLTLTHTALPRMLMYARQKIRQAKPHREQRSASLSF